MAKENMQFEKEFGLKKQSEATCGILLISGKKPTKVKKQIKKICREENHKKANYSKIEEQKKKIKNVFVFPPLCARLKSPLDR